MPALPEIADVYGAIPVIEVPALQIPARPNCGPWPPTAKPSAAGWRSSPTSATKDSPSPNPHRSTLTAILAACEAASAVVSALSRWTD